MRYRIKLVIGITAVFLLLAAQAPAYSVLTHEAVIDAAWDGAIKPLLHGRFPQASDEQIEAARAYAYGGSVIHDLGYYPFGSRLFSNLLHYVRSGDFVDAMLRDAQDVNELAFAVGALAHYTADNAGHPLGINRAVPVMYPKLKAKFGPDVTYVESPKHHLAVEFAFDVVQVAGGAYAPAAFHRFIGFEIAEPLLERTFLAIYGIEMGGLFMDRSLAVGTFRHAVAQTLPEMTKAAWKAKREEIEKITPGVTQASFVFNLSRRDYEQQFGRDYARPHGIARVIGWLYHLIPKIGPFRALAFKVPTPEAEQMFLASFTATGERLAGELRSARARTLTVADTNLDVGKALARGGYSLADDTYDDLLDKLRERKFEGTPPALIADLRRHYGDAFVAATPSRPGRPH